MAGACVDGGYIGIRRRPLERLADVAAVIGNGHELERTEGLSLAGSKIPFRRSCDGVACVVAPPNARRSGGNREQQPLLAGGGMIICADCVGKIAGYSLCAISRDQFY